MNDRLAGLKRVLAISALAAAGALGGTATAAPQCVQVDTIDHTKIVDDQTILFYLRGGKILENKLDSRCFGLKMNTTGISYVVDNNEICGNLQLFKVRDTGNVCSFGAFTPYTPAAPAH